MPSVVHRFRSIPELKLLGDKSKATSLGSLLSSLLLLLLLLLLLSLLRY
jgi:hypothetical protein